MSILEFIKMGGGEEQVLSSLQTHKELNTQLMF